MNYPDGSKISIGDLVWWNEGQSVGYVQAIAESKEEYEKWGFKAPQNFILNKHPFDAAIGTGVAYEDGSFEDEAVGLLTREDRMELDQATALARSLAKADWDTLWYAVTTEVQNCQMIGWSFTLFDDRREVEVIRIPFQKR